MSGLFDRLAARATGKDAIAAPRAIGLFEPMAEPNESALHALDEEVFTPLRPAPSAAAPPPIESPAEIRAVTGPPERAHRVRPDGPAPTNDSIDGVDDARTSPRPSAPTHRVEAHTAVDRPRSPTNVRGHAMPMSESEPVSEEVRADTTTRRSDAPGPTAEQPRTVVPADGWAVEAAPPGASMPTPPVPAEASDDHPAAPTVSVSIGRIEVRAPATTATVAPVSRRRRPPAPRIPLDRYLQDRA